MRINKDKAQDRRVSYGIIVSGAALNVEDHSSGAPAPTEVSPALLIDQLHCVEDKEAKPVPAQLEEGQHMDLVSLFFGLPTIFTTLSVSS